MNTRNVIIAGVAVFLGLIAVYLGNIYFSGVEERSTDVTEQQKLSRIVVAAQDLSFGSTVSPQNVRLVNWPANSIPAGAFTSVADATKNRVALRPIVVGEPILASKVSGTDGRATLSANLPEGMLAYTIPISPESGVGGYVRPGDIVDVLLTRQIPGDGATNSDKMTDVVLQAVPVLGIDQISDDTQTQPAVGKTATLQVTTIEAQKLALATRVGSLDLALRNVADQNPGGSRTVIPRDLSRSRYYIAERKSRGSTPARAASSVIVNAGGAVSRSHSGPTMTVVRGITPTQYEVRRGY